MEPEPSFPPVVAVVVTCDPGPWFEETLRALAGQDYLNLSVLVVDAASAQDPTPRVAAVLPNAYVHLLDRRVAFGRAANEIIGIVEGASHYLFCHDDVAPEPDAVRLMVEEAYRSNAAIVTPKVVDWRRSDQLMSVGLGSDKVGVVHSLVDAGELDQEQHDSVREVFVAPGGATLVRADMFTTLGGFDPVVDHAGEDLDLSWRAHIAGARVIVAPAARVRHLQATVTGLRPDPAPGFAALGDSHRVRTLAACDSAATLAWMLPVVLFFTLGEAVTSLLTGHPAVAVKRIVNLLRAFSRPVALVRSRRRAQRHRTVPDRRACRLQSRGNARLQAWLNARLEGPSIGLPFAPARRMAVPGTLGIEDDDTAWERASRPGTVLSRHDAVPTGPAIVSLPTAAARNVTLASVSPQVRSPQTTDPDAAQIGAGTWRLPVITGIVLLVVFLIGSRSLLGHAIPDVGQLPDTSSGPGAWWSAWLSTWQPGGLGSVGPSPPALGLLSIVGYIFFGAVGTLEHVLVIGPLIVGPIGAYRSARWWGSQRGRIAALIAYALVPVGFNSLAGGHWDGLLVYAAAPWIVGMFARLSDSLPFPSIPPARILGRLVGLGLLTALVAAFVPSFVLVVAVIGIGLALGSLLVAQPPVAARCLTLGVVAAGIGFVLLLPWSAHAFGDRTTLFGVQAGAGGRLGFSTLLRMHTGAIGAGPLGWGLLVAAALPLVIGRSWRLAWAARLWIVALLCVIWAWAALRGAVPAPADPEVMLAPACAALAGAVGLGVVAFELDLPGYRFGWRQGASVLAAAGLLVTAFPILAAVGSGSWNLPRGGPSTVLGSLDYAGGGDYRILWVGAPGALPMASTSLGGGQAYATSFDGLPDLRSLWPAGKPGAARVFASDLRLASGGLTTKLGHLLAPLGVRYLVIPDRNGPVGSGAAGEPTPDALESGLLLQTDLRQVASDSDYRVYVNSAWAPVRVAVSGHALQVARTAAATGGRVVEGTSLAGGSAVLTGRDPASASGNVPAGAAVYVAATPSARWRLRVGGESVAGTPALGAGMLFDLTGGQGGSASLAASTSTPTRVAQVIFAALWVLVAAGVVADRWRRSRAGVPSETVEAEWFTPLAPHRRRASRRRKAVSNAPKGMDSDEVWVDA